MFIIFVNWLGRYCVHVNHWECFGTLSSFLIIWCSIFELSFFKALLQLFKYFNLFLRNINESEIFKATDYILVLANFNRNIPTLLALLALITLQRHTKGITSVLVDSTLNWRTLTE